MSPKALSKMHQPPPSLAPDLPPPPESSPQWSPSWIMTLGGIICICIFFSCYGNLRRHCSNVGGIPLIRNQNRRQLQNDVNPDSPSLQFNSHGLDSFILHSIPTLQFQKKEGETGQGNIDCAVCLGEFKDGERLRSLPNCSHCFHVPCIDTWFQNHSNCPLCRSPVITSILFEPLRRESSIPEPIRGYPVLLEAPVNSTVT